MFLRHSARNCIFRQNRVAIPLECPGRSLDNRYSLSRCLKKNCRANLHVSVPPSGLRMPTMKKSISKPIDKPISEMALAIAVSPRVQIKCIRLIETSAKRLPVEMDLPTDVAITVDVQSKFDSQKREIGVRIQFGLTGRHKERTTGSPPLVIQARFWLAYALESSEGLKPGHISAFGNLNGVYNAWPYWREYVQSVVTRMGLPPLPVPVFRPLALSGLEKLKRTPTRKPQRKRNASN